MVLRALPVWGAALLLGAVVPAAVFTGVTLAPGILPVALAVALGDAIVLGLPTALLFRWRQWTHPVAVAAAGFPIGLVPLALASWPPDSSTFASADGLLVAAGFGLLGTVGALTFWLTLHLCNALTPGAPIAPVRAAAAAGAALCAVALVAAIPYLAEDQTCHNMFRDGRAEVSPRVNVTVEIGQNGSAKTASLFDRFAAARQLDYRHQDESFSLCNELGLVIFGMAVESILSVNLYYLREDDAWRAPAHELIDALQTTWPDRLTFHGAHGRTIPWPENLSPK